MRNTLLSIGLMSWLGLSAGLAFAQATPELPEGALERFAASIRFETISHENEADFDAAPFRAFNRFLDREFPKVKRGIPHETVSGYSRLYRWEGRDPSLKPALIHAHHDVVPIAADQADAWEHPPFAGVIADGHVWGRGTVDDKVGVLALLEAAEPLVAAGHQPERTVYFSFGHDEEIAGPDGAGQIAALLRERGVSLEFTLDEGLVVIENGMAGVERPIALIGIAEKGFVTLRVTARGAGGHSSAPPASTAIGRLSRAITRIEANPLPARLDRPVTDMFDALGPELPWLQRWLFGARPLSNGLIRGALAGNPLTRTMVRTTTAVTMIEGGVKANVLPQSASALVNHRLIPGDTIESVVAHIRNAIDDPSIELEVLDGGREASPVAETDSPAYARLVEVLGKTQPDALAAPALLIAGTDTKHFVGLAEQNFRFNPIRIHSDLASGIHGVNERLPISAYAHAIAFYTELLRTL